MSVEKDTDHSAKLLRYDKSKFTRVASCVLELDTISQVITKLTLFNSVLQKFDSCLRI